MDAVFPAAVDAPDGGEIRACPNFPLPAIARRDDLSWLFLVALADVERVLLCCGLRFISWVEHCRSCEDEAEDDHGHAKGEVQPLAYFAAVVSASIHCGTPSSGVELHAPPFHLLVVSVIDLMLADELDLAITKAVFL